MFLKHIIMVFSFLALPSVMAQTVCQVQIRTENHSGEKYRITFSSRLHSKKECETLAEMHRANFDSNKTKSKTVSYTWQQSKSHSNEIAKREKSRSFRRNR